MDLDLRSVRYFLVTADVGQVTQAAKRLHLSQPALSEALRALECQLGVTLLVRQHGGVELTSAGRDFVEKASILVRLGREAVAAAQQSGGRSDSTLRIGIHGAAWRQVRTILDTFHRARPDVVVVECTLGLTTQDYALHQGQVDAVFNAGVPTRAPFHVQHLRHEPRLVAFSLSHRLVDKEELELSDVLDEQFVRLHPAIPRWCQDLCTLTAERGGAARLTNNEAGSFEEVLAAVGGHELFSAPAETAASAFAPHLRWRKVHGVTPVTLDLVTDSRNQHPELPVLARVAAWVAAKAALGPSGTGEAQQQGMLAQPQTVSRWAGHGRQLNRG